MRLSAKFSETSILEIYVVASPAEMFDHAPGVIVKASRLPSKARQEEMEKEYKHDFLEKLHTHRHRLSLAQPVHGLKLMYTSCNVNAEQIRDLGFQPIPEMEKKETEARMLWKLRKA